MRKIFESHPNNKSPKESRLVAKSDCKDRGRWKLFYYVLHPLERFHKTACLYCKSKGKTAAARENDSKVRPRDLARSCVRACVHHDFNAARAAVLKPRFLVFVPDLFHRGVRDPPCSQKCVRTTHNTKQVTSTTSSLEVLYILASFSREPGSADSLPLCVLD